jgi:hypothetical protein
LLTLVDGRRTVGEIVGLCGRGDFTVASALADLVTRGLLQIDAGDGVEALLRRQQVLRRLETDTPVAAAVPAPPAAVETRVDESAVEQAPVEETPVDEADVETSPDQYPEETLDPAASAEPSSPYEVDDEILADADVVMAPVTAITRPAPRTEVTPQRSEALLPSRRPEHAEEPMLPAAAAAGGGAAPTPAALIERDPNVNKSLLLRLIAGVRGL